MRVLVTGGFGFVGARLGVHLQRRGHEVILASRTEDRSPDWLPQAHALRIDWHDGGSLERCCRGVDAIVHASGMNAQECSSDPVAALEVNGVLTARLAAAAVEVVAAIVARDRAEEAAANAIAAMAKEHVNLTEIGDRCGLSLKEVTRLKRTYLDPLPSGARPISGAAAPQEASRL